MAHGTLSFGFSQFHGHGSWLMCEVALSFGLMSCPSIEKRRVDGRGWQFVTCG